MDTQKPTQSVVLDFSGTFKENEGSKSINQFRKFSSSRPRNRALIDKNSVQQPSHQQEDRATHPKLLQQREHEINNGVSHRITSAAMKYEFPKLEPEKISSAPTTSATNRSEPLSPEPTESATFGNDELIDSQNYINGQLEARSMKAVKLNDNLAAQDLQHLAHVLIELLKSEQLAQRKANQLTDAVQSASVQTKSVVGEKERLKLQIQCLKQDLSAMETKYKMMVLEAKKSKQQFEKWVKELNVQNAKLEGQQRQWQAASNKKEAEYERLKARMQLLQSQRDKSIKRGVTMAGNPPASGTDALQIGKQLETLVAEDYIRQREALANENASLRDSLKTLQTFVQENYNSTINQDADVDATDQTMMNNNTDEGSTVLQLCTDVDCDLPCDVLQKKLENLQTKAEQALSLTQASPISDVELLSTRLREATSLIEQQDQMLRASFFAETIPSPRNSDSFDFACNDNDEELREKEDSLNRESERIERLREQVERDRALLLLEAEKLDADRLRFEQEKFDHCTNRLSAHEKSNSTPTGTGSKVVTFAQDTPVKCAVDISQCAVPPTPYTKSLLQKCMNQDGQETNGNSTTDDESLHTDTVTDEVKRQLKLNSWVC